MFRAHPVQEKLECKHCHFEFPMTEEHFTINRSYKCGFQPKCKVCKMKYDKKNHITLKVKHLLACARCRSKKKGLHFDLTEEWFKIPGTCPILGIKMSKDYSVPWVKDNHPSLDRIIPGGDYTKENVRVVSRRGNTLKNNGSAEEFKKILKYIKRNRA